MPDLDNEILKERFFREIDEWIKTDDPNGEYIHIKPGASQLYFIQEGMRGNIKIGVSVMPNTRINDLSIGNSNELRLLWYCTPKNNRVESDLHLIFNYCRARGEWFKPDIELVRLINETIRHCFDGMIWSTNHLIFDIENE